jgi:hypothetical protein
VCVCVCVCCVCVFGSEAASYVNVHAGALVDARVERLERIHGCEQVVHAADADKRRRVDLDLGAPRQAPGAADGVVIFDPGGHMGHWKCARWFYSMLFYKSAWRSHAAHVWTSTFRLTKKTHVQPFRPASASVWCTLASMRPP